MKRMQGTRKFSHRAMSAVWWLLLAGALFALFECILWSEIPDHLP